VEVCPRLSEKYQVELIGEVLVCGIGGINREDDDGNLRKPSTENVTVERPARGVSGGCLHTSRKGSNLSVGRSAMEILDDQVRQWVSLKGLDGVWLGRDSFHVMAEPR